MKKEIENDVIDMFGGAKRGHDQYSSQSYDVSGRSKIIETNFLISNPEATGNITLYCYDWDKDIVEKHDWKNKIKDPNNYLKQKLKKLSKIPYFKKKKQEFSILLTNNKKMKNLNFKFRKKNKTTDVLSFPLNNSINRKEITGIVRLSDPL